METMTVKELKALLNNYDENLLIKLSGGEASFGEWATLEIGNFETISNPSDKEFVGTIIWKNE